MAEASIGHLSPNVHLKRALGFIQEVEKSTEDFRQRAIAHDRQVESDQPFLQGMVKIFRGSKQLGQQKAALSNDLQLAEHEIDRATALEPTTQIGTEYGILNVVQLRSLVLFMRGQIEMIWGSGDAAIRHFSDSIKMAEFPDAHYMLGVVYEAKYMPAPALWHFERCLHLDPAGEFSVSALREANAMRNYKKRFRGRWATFFILLFLIWPAAIVYFFAKRK